MTSFRFHVFFSCLVLGCVVFLAACGGTKEPTEEEKAQAVFKEATQLREAGKQLEFLREIEKLGSYDKTEAYKQASAQLAQDGLSVKTALASYTGILMFKVKNKLIEEGKAQNPDGDVLVQLDEQDAWGNPLWVEYSEKGHFKFALRSAGADSLLKTEDDLALFYSDKKQTPEEIFAEKQKAAEDAAAAKAEKEKSPASLAVQNVLNSPEPAYKAKPPQETAPKTRPASPPAGPKLKVNSQGEAVVDLDDLLKGQ
ncbi:MAG: hypothetical protein V1816_16425 [Pseudomonadota bacterium]